MKTPTEIFPQVNTSTNRAFDTKSQQHCKLKTKNNNLRENIQGRTREEKKKEKKNQPLAELAGTLYCLLSLELLR